MRTVDYIKLENTYGANNYRPLDVVLTKGRGVWVWDVDGNRYLDCVAAYGAVNHGHCHPKILKTLIDQAHQLAVVSRAFRTDQLALFYQEICDLTNSHLVLPMNSGAEAVETVLKAVRKWGYVRKKVPEDQAKIIVCENNFHGRTISIIGFSTVPYHREHFGPFTPGFVTIPFNDASALEAAIIFNTVGLLVEPIQGEGGINVPDPGYLTEVRRICSERNVCLIFDEIQTGLGRTGKLLAEEHENVVADVTLVGKSLGGGFLPISAVLSNEEILGSFAPGDHGSTFGGNNLACAVGRSALKVLIEEGMIENAAEMGEYFRREIQGIGGKYVKRVRGKGLMLGIELHDDAGGAAAFAKRLLEKGLLCIKAKDNVVRFTPPLVITEEEAAWALESLQAVFRG